MCSKIAIDDLNCHESKSGFRQVLSNRVSNTPSPLLRTSETGAFEAWDVLEDGSSEIPADVQEFLSKKRDMLVL